MFGIVIQNLEFIYVALRPERMENEVKACSGLLKRSGHNIKPCS